MSRQRKMMLRHSSLLLEGFIVAIENNYQGRTRVATEFFYVETKGVGCRSFLCRDIRFYVTTGNDHSKGSIIAIELARPGVLCRDRMFLCRDRV